jgi:hypothetical protein
MKASVDMFPALIANAVVVIGFILIVMFIAQVAEFNAVVTKPSVEIVKTIDITHSIEKCVTKSVFGIQDVLGSCATAAKYVEATDILSGKSWKTGEKSKDNRQHAIWTNIDGNLWRLYVEV